MEDETAGDLYGLRDLLEFDISVAHDTTTAEFRAICHEDVDFLHYIGHVDEDGVVCADGSLDLWTLDTTGVRAFLLNSCHSYQQGEALVEAGADGGIVTLSRVFNDQATKMGQLAAQLLNNGFPLDATMDVLSYGPLSSHRYAAVGDHRAALCQPISSTPSLAGISKSGEENMTLKIHQYFTDSESVGRVTHPLIPEATEWNLVGGVGTQFDISQKELSRYLEQGSIPALVSGEILWDTDRVLKSL
jgi:hypothetical protein